MRYWLLVFSVVAAVVLGVSITRVVYATIGCAMYVIFARRLFKHRKRAVVLIIKIGSLFVVYILLRIFFFDIYRISGHSMEPALSDGDYVLVSKTAWGPRLPRSLYEIPYVNYLTHLYPLNLLDHNLTQQYRRLHSNNTIEKGDIVVFNLPVYQRQYGVKRCTLIPGDTIMAYRSAKASILPKKMTILISGAIH